MDGVHRGAAIVQQAQAGFHFPMSTTVLPMNAVGPLMGRAIAGPLALGQVVMGATTAALRGAVAGDTVDLVGADGQIFTWPIGLVADDNMIGGTELLISEAQADLLGVTTVSRVVVWGFSSRDDVESALASQGLTTRADTKIRRSWSAPDPDSTLGLARTKQLLGEFSYRVNADGSVTLGGAWESQHIPSSGQLFGSIPIRARCHVDIRADMQAALAEVAAAGLAGEIEVANANTYGGCFYPRFNRVTGNLGFLSRHSWGQAFDTNTVSNAQGTTPKMNCDVVRIFRKHNFAWGGNFISKDGMHFEWVGERRDQLPYPSTYCPNVGSPASLNRLPSGRSVAAGPTQRATIFADDGWGLSDIEG